MVVLLRFSEKFGQLDFDSAIARQRIGCQPCVVFDGILCLSVTWIIIRISHTS